MVIFYSPAQKIRDLQFGMLIQEKDLELTVGDMQMHLSAESIITRKLNVEVSFESKAMKLLLGNSRKGT